MHRCGHEEESAELQLGLVKRRELPKLGKCNFRNVPSSVQEEKMKKPAPRVVAVMWIAVAVLLKLYASKGGDASIVGGLLFLVWTAPFGPIWQFWISDIALRFSEPSSVQVIGDVFSVMAGAVFWFFILPGLLQWQQRKNIQ